MKICDCSLAWGALAGIFLCGCQPGQYHQPWSLSAGFFGAQVTIAQPGFTVPAKVVPIPEVSQPTLVVPFGTTQKDVVPVTTASGQQVAVQVTEADVAKPILAVPVAK